VYLNEADEWSRRLLTELGEWALELHRPVPDSTVSLAHSLGGSSATVGFTALSEIARALEQALQHVQLHARSDEKHAQVFSYAAEDIRRLLHQFAAGFLKEPDRQILDALNLIVQTDFATSHTPLDQKAWQSVAQPAFEAPVAPAAFIEEPPLEAPASDPAFFDLPVFESPAVDTQVPPVPEGMAFAAPRSSGFSELAAHAPTLPAATLNLAAAPALIDDYDDDIDLTDALDADLFPIFEEEALELMPRLGGALRQWSARPDNLHSRSEVLRVLHTLKGSARLAGAMRLGEMTHRLESLIEQMGSESLETVQLDPVLTRFDALSRNFDALRTGSEQAMVLPEATVATTSAAAAVAVSSVGTIRPTTALAPLRQIANASVRVRSQLLDRLVNQAGEVMLTRSRLASRLGQLKVSLADLSGNLDRLRGQLRDIEVQSESQMQSRMALAKDSALDFDPLEFDRFTRVQELTRMMAESVNDVATVQRNLQRTVEGTEDDLIAQGRQARELQRDLLRTRMVEFEGISERLYGVVRQAAKDVGKQVRLDITGGSMDIDRGVLERMAPAFEHLLRNSVAHGIEDPAQRLQAGKPVAGIITINLQHQSNEISVEFNDDGAGLDLQRIREKAVSSGVVPDAFALTDAQAADLIFAPGFSTAASVTEISGRGIGMDVVRSEVNALGGRIEISSEWGKGTRFKLVLPLTTAVTQVVMLRLGELVIGVAANVTEIVKRVPAADLEQSYRTGQFSHAGDLFPFFWAGALLQASLHSDEAVAKNLPVAIFRSAGQRVAVHVDEVLGNQEVVVKNLGPQLSRLPGLTGMSVLASGAVVLIYNPVALASVYGAQAVALRASGQATLLPTHPAMGQSFPALLGGAAQVPLIMVVDDSITVRRVTQRLLKREGYRVVLASDGLQALELLQDEKPTLVLSDIEMPRMDGFDLARNIRSDSKLRDLPIIMITSRIAQKHREHARELGVDHYLGKPYSEDELMGLVRHYCNAPVES
jgi:chemosensory pili system protein ChpA (sensor histidine kinase/response regulator)